MYVIEKIEVHLIEQVEEGNCDVKAKLWFREKYWQTQLFTWIACGTGIALTEKAIGERKNETIFIF